MPTSTSSFNCTFMELKYGGEIDGEGVGGALIVPLWNWNGVGVVASGFVVGFNCTFMELK